MELLSEYLSFIITQSPFINFIAISPKYTGDGVSTSAELWTHKIKDGLSMVRLLKCLPKQMIAQCQSINIIISKRMDGDIS